MNTNKFTHHHLHTVLARLCAGHDFLIAYSGGLDSHVLLHAFATLANEQKIKLSAVHINHGLQPEADDWATHCRHTCESLAVPLTIIRVDAGADRGESPEASARTARYNALADCLQSGQVLLTAQHLDDQAETFMLQLVRGAGLRGLSAMPEVQPFATGFLVRPLLGFSREALGDYAERHSLEWIDDSSNTNLAYDRNYLRHKVMPSLYERWPAARSTIARAAGLAAETITLAETLARQDLIKTKDVADNALNVPVLQAMASDRRRNLLRIWIRDQGFPVPSASILERITGEVLNAAADREPLVSWEQAEIRRYRDKLYILPVLSEATPAMRLVWDRVTLSLPLGELCYHRTQGRGLHASVLTDYRLEIRFRLGGESIRPAGRGRRRRNVKKLLQEYSVPPWLRDRMPLIYVGEHLAAIPGICVDNDWAAAESEPGITPYWRLPPALAGQMPAE